MLAALPSALPAAAARRGRRLRAHSGCLGPAVTQVLSNQGGQLCGLYKQFSRQAVGFMSALSCLDTVVWN